MSYALDQDLYNTFGQKNIEKWADLDNDEDAGVIATRIAWAIEAADVYIDSRLQHRYEVPFESIPKIIVLMSSLYAGVLLYDGRMVLQGSTVRDEVATQRKMFDKYLHQILRGQLRLLHPLSGELIALRSENTPFITTQNSSESNDADQDCC